MLTVDCIHCGAFEPTLDERRVLERRTLLQGFQCPRCDDECHVHVDGVRVTPGCVPPLVPLGPVRS